MSKNQWHRIPEFVLLVMRWSDPNTLLQCARISKSWYQIIKDHDHFVCEHRCRHTMKPSSTPDWKSVYMESVQFTRNLKQALQSNMRPFAIQPIVEHELKSDYIRAIAINHMEWIEPIQSCDLLNQAIWHLGHDKKFQVVSHDTRFESSETHIKWIEEKSDSPFVLLNGFDQMGGHVSVWKMEA